LRCKIHATCVTPAVAKTLLNTVSVYIKPEAMMRPPHLYYIQVLFIAVCDTHIMYQGSDAGKKTIGMKVDRRHLHAILRVIPREYEGVT